MKIYVYDHGWSGAEILIATDREEATKKLVDPLIQEIHKRNALHIMHYYDPKSPLYEPDRYNPYTSQLERLTTYRGELLQEYEIVHGLLITTEGEG